MFSLGRTYPTVSQNRQNAGRLGANGGAGPCAESRRRNGGKAP